MPKFTTYTHSEPNRDIVVGLSGDRAVVKDGELEIHCGATRPHLVTNVRFQGIPLLWTGNVGGVDRPFSCEARPNLTVHTLAIRRAVEARDSAAKAERLAELRRQVDAAEQRCVELQEELDAAQDAAG